MKKKTKNGIYMLIAGILMIFNAGFNRIAWTIAFGVLTIILAWCYLNERDDSWV